MVDNSTIATIAVTVSAISLTISYLNYRRDRTNAKIIVFKTALIGGSKSTKPLTSINITNTGRRQLTINMVGYRRFHSAPTIINAPMLPKKLAEGDDIVCIFDKSEILKSGSWKGVAYVFACDSTGKMYYCNIGPAYRVWAFKFYNLLTGPIHRIRQADD